MAHSVLRYHLCTQTRPSFQNGMSVAELMEQYSKEEPFANASSWERGFCLHSDWFISYFFEYYWLGKEIGPLEKILGSEIKDSRKTTGLCNNNKENCTWDMLACHYITPENMRSLHNGTLSQ